MAANTQSKIRAVPTNIITGFLGVGKTTIILNLFDQRPKNERWAVLVNEFGEVGIDGDFLKRNQNENTNKRIFVREVPGGCMCCAAGLPMQIALNQLLTEARPDRLLIEPTGLGHPKEVLEVLSAKYYRDVLNIQQCITLVDARKLTDRRYTEHDTFNQQIDMADLIVGNKADLYDNSARKTLKNYITMRHGSSVPIQFSEKGYLSLSSLIGESSIVKTLNTRHRHTHSAKQETNINDQVIPESGYLKIKNSGEGFQSIGWRFSPIKTFSRRALFTWFRTLNIERAKGLFITDEGIFAYNLTMDSLKEMELDECNESRIEIIYQTDSIVNEDALFACIEN